MDIDTYSKQFLRDTVAAHERCLKSASAQVWYWLKGKQLEETTMKMHIGLLCLLEDFNRKTYFLRLYDMDSDSIPWTQDVEDLIFITSPEVFLDTYESKEFMICFNYTSVEEGKDMKKEIDKTTAKLKRLKQDPEYARRKFEIAVFFKLIGIANTKVIDTKTRSFIYDFLKMENVITTPKTSTEDDPKDQPKCYSNSEANNVGKAQTAEIIDEIITGLAELDRKETKCPISNGKPEKPEAQEIDTTAPLTKPRTASKDLNEIVCPTISHDTHSADEIPNSENGVTDDVDYGENTCPLQKKEDTTETQEAPDVPNNTPFTTHVAPPVAKPRTLPPLPSTPPPVPPKIKKKVSTKKTAPPTPPTSSASGYSEMKIQRGKPEVDKDKDNECTTVAVVAPPKRGLRITKEDIGLPYDFKHIYGFHSDN